MASQSTRRREPPTETGTNHPISSDNMNKIDLEEKCGIEIQTYHLTNLDTKVRIRNSVTIHFAGYFLDSMQQWTALSQDYDKNCYKEGSKRYRRDPEDPEADPVPFWRTDSVLGLLEKRHGLVLFCSTWPEHGDKVLPGPVTLTLGGEEHSLVPSLSVALRDMLLGDVRVVRVPPSELYGLDMEPLEPRAPPREVLLEGARGTRGQETREDSGEEGEEGPAPNKPDKPESYWSSSSEDEFDPDEEYSEPWCDAPGAKGDRATFLRVVPKVGGKEVDSEVHRGLRGLVYVLQLLAFGESAPPKEIIHVKKPLETTDKKTEKPDSSKDT